MGSIIAGDPWYEEISIANTGNNWPDYKLLVEAWALKHASIDILHGTASTAAADYNQKRHDLFFLIVSTQSDKTRHLLRTIDVGDAEGAWKILKDHYMSMAKAFIRKELKTMLKLRQGGKTVPEFISAVQACHGRLEAAVKETKVDILDILLQLLIVEGLNPKDKQYSATLHQGLVVDDEIIPPLIELPS